MTLEEVKDYLYATLKILTKNTDEEIRAYIEAIETESPKMTIAELQKEITKLNEGRIRIPELTLIEGKDIPKDAVLLEAVVYLRYREPYKNWFDVTKTLPVLVRINKEENK